MNSSPEGIYICSLCKAFICKEDEYKNNEIPHQELNTLDYVALNKFENLCYNLDFTKKVTLNSGIPLFSYWYNSYDNGQALCISGIIDLNCNRCKQKIGFIPVSTTAQMNDLRDKLILIKERLTYSEAQLKYEDSIFKTPTRLGEESMMKSEDRRLRRRKSLFLTKLEENIDNIHQAMAKCREKYGLMFDFYKSLVSRLEMIENHSITLQTILFNLTKVSLSKKSKGKVSTSSINSSEHPESKRKMYLIYKPPKKESYNNEDVQNLLLVPKESTGTKKRKREDSEEKIERPKGKLVKQSK